MNGLFKASTTTSSFFVNYPNHLYIRSSAFFGVVAGGGVFRSMCDPQGHIKRPDQREGNEESANFTQSREQESVARRAQVKRVRAGASPNLGDKRSV